MRFEKWKARFQSLAGKSKQPVDVNLAKYQRDRKQFFSGLEGTCDWPIGKDYPILSDWYQPGGVASGHYFHQDLWAARKIFQANPRRHIDVGSRVDGFVAHVATFREIEIYDLRPIESKVRNMLFAKHDFMIGSAEQICDSLSCLHAIEHFGLGRYGDEIDPRGYQKGFANISALVEEFGTFYFSVPIGRQRVEFNAHRVFGLRTVIQLWESHGFDLREFSYVDDVGDIHLDVKLAPSDINGNMGLELGCGLFELVRLPRRNIR